MTNNQPDDSKLKAVEFLEQGIALGISEKYEDAIRAFDKAIEINPDYASAWYNKGNALFT